MNEPHTYVSEGIRHLRTCAACGRGANASIHRSNGACTIKLDGVDLRVIEEALREEMLRDGDLHGIRNVRRRDLMERLNRARNEPI